MSIFLSRLPKIVEEQGAWLRDNPLIHSGVLASGAETKTKNFYSGEQFDEMIFISSTGGAWNIYISINNAEHQLSDRVTYSGGSSDYGFVFKYPIPHDTKDKAISFRIVSTSGGDHTFGLSIPNPNINKLDARSTIIDKADNLQKHLKNLLEVLSETIEGGEEAETDRIIAAYDIENVFIETSTPTPWQLYMTIHSTEHQLTLNSLGTPGVGEQNIWRASVPESTKGLAVKFRVVSISGSAHTAKIFIENLVKKDVGIIKSDVGIIKNNTAKIEGVEVEIKKSISLTKIQNEFVDHVEEPVEPGYTGLVALLGRKTNYKLDIVTKGGESYFNNVLLYGSKTMRINENGEILWERIESVVRGAVASDDRCYVGNEAGTLRRIDWNNGNQLWEVSTGNEIRGLAVNVGGSHVVYTGHDNGEVQCRNEDGTLLWKFTGHTERVTGVVTTSDGFISCGYNGEVKRVKPADGTVDVNGILQDAVMWEVTTAQTTLRDIAASVDGNVVLVSLTSRVYKINPADGSEIFEVILSPSGGGAYYIDTDTNGNIYIPTLSAGIAKLNKDGQETDRILPDSVFSTHESIYVHNNTMFTTHYINKSINRSLQNKNAIRQGINFSLILQIKGFKTVS